MTTQVTTKVLPSVTAVIALVHDILITLGLYALIGWEVTPNVVA